MMMCWSFLESNYDHFISLYIYKHIGIQNNGHTYETLHVYIIILISSEWKIAAPILLWVGPNDDRTCPFLPTATLNLQFQSPYGTCPPWIVIGRLIKLNSRAASSFRRLQSPIISVSRPFVYAKIIYWKQLEQLPLYQSVSYYKNSDDIEEMREHFILGSTFHLLRESCDEEAFYH
jgi:hypothetical protein